MSKENKEEASEIETSDESSSFEEPPTDLQEVESPELEEELEDEDSVPPEWPDVGTDDFAEGLVVEDEADLLNAETNDSVIAALNALEDAAGVVEEEHGLDGEAPVEAELEFESVEPVPAPAAATVGPLTPEQWIALRAEMRDTAEAMIRELVPELAEQIIRQEIQRLTDDFSADEPPSTS